MMYWIMNETTLLDLKDEAEVILVKIRKPPATVLCSIDSIGKEKRDRKKTVEPRSLGLFPAKLATTKSPPWPSSTP
jgi:hypothetical protein